MGIINFVYSLFYVRKTCEYCGKKYYMDKKDSLEESLYNVCSYNCAINRLSNDCKTCDHCGKKYYINKKVISETSYNVCSTDCEIKASNDCIK
jgi:hypothetical protein